LLIPFDFLGLSRAQQAGTSYSRQSQSFPRAGRTHHLSRLSLLAVYDTHAPDHPLFRRLAFLRRRSRVVELVAAQVREMCSSPLVEPYRNAEAEEGNGREYPAPDFPCSVPHNTMTNSTFPRSTRPVPPLLHTI
jgi:hypothetical protein